jgi:FkbM family methyltransferase
LDNFKILQRNIKNYSNILALNMALGPARGSMTLVDRGTGEWGFSLVLNPADCAAPRAIQDVSVTTVQALLDDYRASGIDILKLDIEGGEYTLFKTSLAWIDQTRIIFAELHDRIAPGSTTLFQDSTKGRLPASEHGEKLMSIRG